jgi:hypothetical protein
MGRAPYAVSHQSHEDDGNDQERQFLPHDRFSDSFKARDAVERPPLRHGD